MLEIVCNKWSRTLDVNFTIGEIGIAFIVNNTANVNMYIHFI